MSSPADCLPLSLSDDELSQVLRAAEALQPPDRLVFLEMVARDLRGQPVVGSGILHRLLREAQSQFLQARPILDDAAKKMPPRYSRSREFVCRPGRRRQAHSA
jgi:hypothetical protein